MKLKYLEKKIMKIFSRQNRKQGKLKIFQISNLALKEIKV